METVGKGSSKDGMYELSVECGGDGVDDDNRSATERLGKRSHESGGHVVQRDAWANGPGQKKSSLCIR